MTRGVAPAFLGLALLAAAALVRPTPQPTVAPAVSVALGGLNGLVVDYLWLRASIQQERGEFFEVQQTARWMAALQPQLGGLLAFQAQNMAFNISESFAGSEDRWRWIRASLELLVHEGLERGPSDPIIPKTIGWIIGSKVADPEAERSEDYLRYWYREWSERLEGPPADLARQGLDQQRMAALERRFGAMDWRAPETHAVYWLAEAVERAGGPGRRIVLDRLLVHALWDAFRRGRLQVGPEGINRQPEPSLQMGVETLFADTIRLHPTDDSLPVAQRAFRLEALLLLHFAGHSEAAERWYRHLQTVYPDDQSLSQPLDRFILGATGPSS